jgi:hypothetical protein
VADVTRTKRQEALLESSAAWAWWLAGYERGVESGFAEGYAAAIRVLDEAATALAALRPEVAKDADARAARAAMLAVASPEDLDARRRACAESWGLEAGAA